MVDISLQLIGLDIWEMLIEYVESAIERVRALDKNPANRWPQTLGTRVYLLAERVMNRK